MSMVLSHVQGDYAVHITPDKGIHLCKALFAQNVLRAVRNPVLPLISRQT